MVLVNSRDSWNLHLFTPPVCTVSVTVNELLHISESGKCTWIIPAWVTGNQSGCRLRDAQRLPTGRFSLFGNGEILAQATLLGLNLWGTWSGQGLWTDCLMMLLWMMLPIPFTLLGFPQKTIFFLCSFKFISILRKEGGIVCGLWLGWEAPTLTYFISFKPQSHPGIGYSYTCFSQGRRKGQTGPWNKNIVSEHTGS